MTKIELIIREIQRVPEGLLDEILDFVRFVEAREGRHPSETALASEAVLARDWLRPEEEAAWADL